ncbi:M23 family metallopeptidase [Pelagerythrobacter marensis]|uniref:Membrane protein n=1 Tax=Pelagerythrobacter marensis TaxID=543877 RepID=A0A0G3X490_9SPHN|nr:M23 family metallopeptidase [Pelagerythrobacter marensis]AKM06360.1 Membrane protein [Pelagerythrobacter marensis]
MKRLALILALPLLIAAGDPATETEHVVAEGETLGGIANRAGVPASVIAAANGLREPYVVQQGQTLAIPRQRTYTVKPGDTGFAIAVRHGVPFATIAVANGLEAPYRIRPGQRLIIPAVLKSPPPVAAAPAKPYFRPPHDGRVRLGYALRADGGGHDGIDYAVRSGDMIRAAASGTVVEARRDAPRFGRLVVIDHGNGWRSAYAHLGRVTVKTGDVVKSGERIGIAGASGDAEAPELHFEIRKGSRKLDPQEHFRGKPGS